MSPFLSIRYSIEINGVFQSIPFVLPVKYQISGTILFYGVSKEIIKKSPIQSAENVMCDQNIRGMNRT